MKGFANISAAMLAKLLGVELTGRTILLRRPEQPGPHFLTGQIQLYLALCFYANTNDGMCDLISLSDLASLIHKNPKTVLRSLQLLSDSGFLSFQVLSDHQVQIQLHHLSDMYLRRGEGGKGYITCSKELLSRLLAATTIDPLRVMITALLVQHSQSLTSTSGRISGRIPFDSLKSSFPLSSRPRDIRKAASPLGLFGSLFSRVRPDTKAAIQVQMKEEFNGKYIKSRIRLEAKDILSRELTAINDAITSMNQKITENGYIPIHEAGILSQHQIDVFEAVSISDPGHKLPLLELSSSVRNDCATLAQDFGIESVLQAVRIFYQRYLLPGNWKQNPSKSLGGLIRSILSELFSLSQEVFF